MSRYPMNRFNSKIEIKNLYFPDGMTRLPEDLKAWKKKFKKVGSNVMVSVKVMDSKLTIKQIVELHGSKTMAELLAIQPTTWRKATEAEVVEYQRGLIDYQGRCLNLKVKSTVRKQKEAMANLAKARRQLASSSNQLVLANNRLKNASDAFGKFAAQHPTHKCVVSANTKSEK